MATSYYIVKAMAKGKTWYELFTHLEYAMKVAYTYHQRGSASCIVKKGESGETAKPLNAEEEKTVYEFLYGRDAAR